MALMGFNKNIVFRMAGPCSLENGHAMFAAAECLVEFRNKFPEFDIIFKGSFDMANKTSNYSEQGVGLGEGLRLLGEVNTRYRLHTTTDVPPPEQATAVAAICDVIQIPTFLGRQTDILMAAAKTGKNKFR
jgi:2-dehydro-3-deoxyphosphooctonate aldolase (KDO 8-P synthase)